MGGVRTRVRGAAGRGRGKPARPPKALVEIAGQSLADRGVALLRAGGAAPVVVVTGAAAAEPPGALIVHNPDWPSGMGSSLAAGLTALPDAAEAAVIALADQPLVGPEAVRRLIAAYDQGASVAVAGYDGQPRNPVLIARPHWAEVIAAAVGDSRRARVPALAPGARHPGRMRRYRQPGRRRHARGPGRRVSEGGAVDSGRRRADVHPPGVPDGLARLQDEQVGAGDEGVRRAGHRLDREGAPAVRRVQRVAGEHLQPAVALAGPEPDAALRSRQPRPGPAVGAAVQAGERVIEPDVGQPARRRGSRTGCRRRPRPARAGCRGPRSAASARRARSARNHR